MAPGAEGAPLGLFKGSQMVAEVEANSIVNSCTCFCTWGQCPLQHAEGFDFFQISKIRGRATVGSCGELTNGGEAWFGMTRSPIRQKL